MRFAFAGGVEGFFIAYRRFNFCKIIFANIFIEDLAYLDIIDALFVSFLVG